MKYLAEVIEEALGSAMFISDVSHNYNGSVIVVTLANGSVYHLDIEKVK